MTIPLAVETDSVTDAVEAKRLRKAAKRAALEAEPTEVAAEDPHMEDAAEARRLRKAAKRAAQEIASRGDAVDPDNDEDAAEAKRLRKAAKQAAKQAALEVAPIEAPVEPHGNEDSVEAKRLRKAAKQAASEATPVEDAGVPDDNEAAAEAKRLRKAAKRAALEASSAELSRDGDDTAAVAEAKRARKMSKEAALECVSAEPVIGTQPIEAKKERTLEEMEELRQKRKDRKQKEREAKKTRLDDMTVFVAGVPRDCEKDALREHFAAHGDIEGIKLLEDKYKDKHRGLAYISYKTKSEAEAALKLNDTEFRGKRLSVQPSKYKNPLIEWKGFEVCINYFPKEQSDEDLRKVFAKCGGIESLRRSRWEDGVPKGMAFIVFKDGASMRNALKLDGTPIGDKTIDVKKSERAIQGKKPSAIGSQENGKAGKSGKGKGKGGKAAKGNGKGKQAKSDQP